MTLAAALIGSWRLVDFVTHDARGHLARPFGVHPHGRLVYTPGGLMSVQIACAARPTLRTSGFDDAVPEDERTAFRSYLAYSGRYHLDGDSVLHEVDLSLDPDWVGQQLSRTAALAGDQLILRTPSSFAINGDQEPAELTWRREAA